MAKSAKQKKAVITYETEWSDENQDRCPGYLIVKYDRYGTTYEMLVRCEASHPHQYIVKVDDGRERVPLYSFIPRLFTASELQARLAARDKNAARQQARQGVGVKNLRANLDVSPEVLEWLESQPAVISEAETSPESNDLVSTGSLASPDLADDRDDDIPAV